MQILPPINRALSLANAEYMRRNGVAIPVSLTAFDPYWTIDAAGREIDQWAIDEARALMAAATVAVASGSIKGNIFFLIGSAAKRRADWARIPWWKRIFTDDALPTLPRIPPSLANDPYLRDLNRRLAAHPDEHPVYDKEISSALDLELLIQDSARIKSQSLPFTAGGGGIGLLTESALEYIHALARGFTPEQRLQMAILTRNNLINEGASKSLVRFWNKEVADLSWLVRHHPPL